jgi:hypothetical protein
MFEIESKDQDTIIISTKTTSIKFDLATESIDAGLEVGKIVGPGEFEIGEVAIRGIAVGGDKTIYDAVMNNVHVGIIGGIEDAMALDELGVSDILCTSSVRAVREIEPKLVVAMGNIDGMVMDLKVSARTEKKLKVKSLESLPATLEVVALA